MSWMAAVISAPETPSMAAWWTLLRSANEPGGYALDVVETLDDVELPQRAVEVERPRVQPGRLDAQLAPVARLRQRDVPDVELEVEVGVVHPVRMVEIERHPGELLPVRRHERHRAR